MAIVTGTWAGAAIQPVASRDGASPYSRALGAGCYTGHHPFQKQRVALPLGADAALKAAEA